ncbi:MAG: DNA translocase FtsK [Vicinamibacteria bacterium]|nr:DNA translocase FtsK [Vicinamibacteria bacterium]
MARRILSVSDIRRELYWAAGGPHAAGAGEPSHAILGKLFHGVYGALTGNDERLSFMRPLERVDASLELWKSELIRHTYAWIVGPSLAENRAALREKTQEVLSFWASARELCDWLADVIWAQRAAGRSIAAMRSALFRGHEQDVAVEINDPAWSDVVVVEGRIDAVLVQPATGTPCVVELKTGRAAPEADLCQAALYHALLSEVERRPDTRLALLTFSPKRVERLFSAAQLSEAQLALKALVGRLAGVSPATSKKAAAPKKPGASGRQAPPASAAAHHVELGRRLINAFSEFGVRLRLEGDPLVGPRFIRFFAEPERGVRMKEIAGLATSVWMRLRTEQPPQISLQSGRVAIDVARPDPQPIDWRDLHAQLPAVTREGASRFPVGVAIDGSLRWADLAEPQNAHFLVAGTTGSGKSEWLRAMTASLLAVNRPETLQLVLIDPKRTAFGPFAVSRFLRREIVYPSDDDVTLVLSDLIEEMERRYRVMSEAGASDLTAFNRDALHPCSRIVCLCDEYADLILRDRRQRQTLEDQVARLGSKARAAGIHLVFATQRASREVVRGVIDTNFSARVALRVAKEIDSRLIIEHPGAATLLGNGDLLFKDLGEPVRLQSPLVSENDLQSIL